MGYCLKRTRREQQRGNWTAIDKDRLCAGSTVCNWTKKGRQILAPLVRLPAGQMPPAHLQVAPWPALALAHAHSEVQVGADVPLAGRHQRPLSHLARLADEEALLGGLCIAGDVLPRPEHPSKSWGLGVDYVGGAAREAQRLRT